MRHLFILFYCGGGQRQIFYFCYFVFTCSAATSWIGDRVNKAVFWVGNQSLNVRNNNHHNWTNGLSFVWPPRCSSNCLGFSGLTRGPWVFFTVHEEHLDAVALTGCARGAHTHPLSSYFLVRSSTALRLLSGELAVLYYCMLKISAWSPPRILLEPLTQTLCLYTLLLLPLSQFNFNFYTITTATLYLKVCTVLHAGMTSRFSSSTPIRS